MFSKLRKIVKEFVDKVSTKELSEEELEEVLQELEIQLVENDVAFSVAEKIASDLKEALTGRRVARGSDVRELVLSTLRDSLKQIFTHKAGLDLVAEAREKCREGEPLRLVFLGVNGVGKTTTIAKVAHLYKKNGITPLVAAADTFRAGAQEQLKLHASRLGIPIITGKYGADPASVAYDAIAHAKARRYCVVLIDTAGRMHTDKDLVEELKKIVRVSKPHYKILVVDALTGNDAVEQARFFDESVGVDLVILTKVDADAKGGSALSVAYEIGKPILFLGIGQEYDDLREFDPDWLIERILG